MNLRFCLFGLLLAAVLLIRVKCYFKRDVLLEHIKKDSFSCLVAIPGVGRETALKILLKQK